jgi:zinc/manganese transport system substrate-binding protein
MKIIIRSSIFILSLIIFLSLISCKNSKKEEDERAVITVSTSYLECAVKDLSGDKFRVLRLAPPGMCPGHFDISPGQIKDIKKTSLLLRFDFQKSLDKKISHLMGKNFRIKKIIAPEGMCLPETYSTCVKDTCQALISQYPEYKEHFDSNLKNIIKNLSELEKECKKNIKNAGLENAKVISSGHQDEFCKWLGLDVVASFSGANASNPRDLQELITKGKSSGVIFVIANRQEGIQQADAYAIHLKAKKVIFSNFPDMSDKENTFSDLIRSNINHLIKAAGNK